ncbi:hypothetical protein QZH41_010706, partial [Actinostola sp. cb2023]
VSRVSKLHALELEKVWIAVYDCDLRDEQVRCLAARHNNANRGSMATNFMTRVHSCREWLYQMAGKSDVTDETPKSSQKWKQECQKMYVPTDKDGNTLEPTLQAALLSREVYTEFKKVGDLFKAGKIKDQKTKKSKKGKGLKSEITQNQLGMPLQGLSDETKLALLKEVTTTTISLKEMKSKCDRIKKKQFVVAAFLRHTGEVNFESIKERFPLHTTEEKLAQFSQSAITKTKTPEEIVSFFDRAIEWEKQEGVGPINLHEEREGIYIYERGTNYGILMEGAIDNIGLEEIKRIFRSGPFKGFSLIMAAITEVGYSTYQ